MPATFVVDASLVAAFLLREPEGKKFDSILQLLAEGKSNIHVPALFAFELLNILAMAERRKRISAAQKANLLLEWELIPIVEYPPPEPNARRRILALAFTHQLTAYDAAYLELAERIHAKLVSLDSGLLKLKRAYDWIS